MRDAPFFLSSRRGQSYLISDFSAFGGFAGFSNDSWGEVCQALLSLPFGGKFIYLGFVFLEDPTLT